MNSVRNWSIFAFALMMATGCASTDPNAQRQISKKDRISMLVSIAAANIAENDTTSALQTLGQIRDFDENNSEEWYLYALAYLQKNEIKLATESARRSVKLDPKFSAAKNTLGKILLDQGKYQESEKYLLESASDLLFRESYLPKTNLGILYYKQGLLKKSDTWLTKAIADGGPLECMAYFYRGKVKSDLNDLVSAERDFARSARGSCSGLADAHVAIGKTFIREKKYDQARAKFIEIQRLFPSSEVSDEATQYLREIP